MGDDTLHTPLPFFNSPDFISSTPPAADGKDNTTVDLVFVDFIESQLLEVLNGLQTAKKYTSADVQPYSSILFDQVLGVFAELKWHPIPE